MNKLFLAMVAASLLMLSGCGNLSPRIDQDIDNANGRIDNLDTITNGFKNELANLRNENEIQNSKIGQMQQGFANLQSNYENSGVQILSGPGGLIFSVVALVGVCGMMVIVFHYRGEAQRKEKAADILAETIARKGDPVLTDKIFQAALYTDVEEDVLKLMMKHQH
jgi:outer membrane murein-binding lipoprotein Lpp